MKARKKRTEYAKAKDKAWMWFSRFVRLRDCLATTGDRRRGACITCGDIYPFERLQAGHYVQGRSNSVLFEERAVYAQCYKCNVLEHGKLDVYAMIMYSKYSEREIEEMVGSKWDIKKYTVVELTEKAEYYKNKFISLYNGNNCNL